MFIYFSSRISLRIILSRRVPVRRFHFSCQHIFCKRLGTIEKNRLQKQKSHFTVDALFLFPCIVSEQNQCAGWHARPKAFFCCQRKTFLPQFFQDLNPMTLNTLVTVTSLQAYFFHDFSSLSQVYNTSHFCFELLGVFD